MSIRPIDMQVLLPKSQSISNMNQTLVNKGENALHQTYTNDKKVQEKKSTQVNDLNKKENPLIKNNSNNNKNNSNSKHDNNKNQKKNNDEKKQSNNEITYSVGGTIDIKV